MVVIRNRLSQMLAGGPRQFAELRDKLIVRVEDISSQREVSNELRRFGLETVQLDNSPILITRPEAPVDEVLRRVADMAENNTKVRQGIETVREAREAGQDILEAAAPTLAATRQMRTEVAANALVEAVDFVTSSADFGPENLRESPSSMDNVTLEGIESEAQTLGELNNNLGMEEVWEITRGENSISCIFDTGYAEGIIGESRIMDTFHGDGVGSVYAPSEGHGTMTAGAMAASKDDGLPFNGVAPDSDVILVRITDGEGQIRSDIIAEAWDYITSQDFSRPVITNHSYGSPICSGRPKQSFCSGPDIDVIDVANEDAFISSFYAAGNEAMRCGHRPSGLTSAVTGANSIESVITVGALRFDGLEAQRYSSHGRGDCAPISDPKPNVSCALPMKTYYGDGDGWRIKDMSTGFGGSSGGTSHASPYTAGLAALMQSKAMAENSEPLQTEELKNKLQNTAVPPRPTQVNQIGFLLSPDGYDARFGFGQIQPIEAIEAV